MLDSEFVITDEDELMFGDLSFKPTKRIRLSYVSLWVEIEKEES